MQASVTTNNAIVKSGVVVIWQKPYIALEVSMGVNIYIPYDIRPWGTWFTTFTFGTL